MTGDANKKNGVVVVVVCWWLFVVRCWLLCCCVVVLLFVVPCFLFLFRLSGCRLKPRRGFTRQPENSARAHLRVPALQTPPKFHEKNPKRGKKGMILWREREKKREILGLPPFGAPPFGVPPFTPVPSSDPHPLGPHTSGPAPFRVPPFRPTPDWPNGIGQNWPNQDGQKRIGHSTMATACEIHTFKASRSQICFSYTIFLVSSSSDPFNSRCLADAEWSTFVHITMFFTGVSVDRTKHFTTTAASRTPSTRGEPHVRRVSTKLSTPPRMSHFISLVCRNRE